MSALWTDRELTTAFGARPSAPPAGSVTGVSIDTRTLQAGDLFVALRGERFDGHDYLAPARATGAVAALAERGLGDAMPGLQVPDTLAALQQLAADYGRAWTREAGTRSSRMMSSALRTRGRAWGAGGAVA